MDTLRDRLVELANNAPTGGSPAAELWARGKRAQRLRAAALSATLLVVLGAVGTEIGARLVGAGDDRSSVASRGTVGIELPIEYPVQEEPAELPDLGNAPGPLAAIWLDRGGGGAPEAVGLVAETGKFGTLPIDIHVSGAQDEADDPRVALSPDGRRIAYATPQHEVVVHDLVSGEKEFPTIENRTLAAYDWMDATHLYGVAGSASGASWTDSEGWVWEPGKAPKLVNLAEYPGQPYLGYGPPYGGKDLMIGGQGPSLCAAPDPQEVSTDRPRFEVPVLCDVLGVVGSEILLGHWNSKHDPQYADGTVVALDIAGADRPYLDPALRGPGADHAFDDPARRQVVATAGAPHRVTFATYLIGELLEASGGAS